MERNFGKAATLLLSFGSLPSTQDTESEVKLTDGLDFQIQLLNYSQVMLSDYLGAPIILDFFATWCKPCATQIIELQKLQVKFPNVHIISVSIEKDDTISILEGYSLEHEMDWIVGRDATLKAASRYQINSIPTMAFFNSQGIRKYIDHPPGITSESVMSSWIRAD
ncbi:MAG: TlpA family protein disulfide reductase [Candidatus Hodarchaeales archaeon]